MKTYIRAGSIEYDSVGNELTLQQSSYFRNSVVRDNKGRLLVCYHATYSDFDTFDKSKVGSGSGGSFGSGFYFTPRESFATTYGDRTLACYLNLTNPLDYMEYGVNKRIIDLMQKYGYEFNPEDVENCTQEYAEDAYDIVDIIWGNGYSSEDFSECLVKAGYDGILVGDDEIIAFEPNQIKSISNKNPTANNSINL